MTELEAYSQELLEKMERHLLELQLDHPKPSERAKHAIPYLERCLDKLEEALKKYPFGKRSEEINFFKHIKPAVMARLIFACEVHNKEVFRPLTGSAEEKDYLADAVEEVDAFFQKQEGLYQYYRDKLDGYDIVFFVREVPDRLNFRELPIEIDPVYFYGRKDFSTGFDFLFAKFKAYELLRDHLENELEALLAVGEEVRPDEINFTGSAADFVQLVEIFKAAGKPVNPETGQPASDQEMFDLLKKALNPDLPEGVDFDTLKLITGDSDLAERMAESMQKLYKQWEDEEKDIDYHEEDGEDDEEDNPEK
ncbi:MAG TPA: RteC domain-containing protein [Mucilaginibacter sp.]|nr:RteC domain-containing protein [Mucilaginibacter sp.]